MGFRRSRDRALLGTVAVFGFYPLCLGLRAFRRVSVSLAFRRGGFCKGQVGGQLTTARRKATLFARLCFSQPILPPQSLSRCLRVPRVCGGERWENKEKKESQLCLNEGVVISSRLVPILPPKPRSLSPNWTGSPWLSYCFSVFKDASDTLPVVF